MRRHKVRWAKDRFSSNDSAGCYINMLAQLKKYALSLIGCHDLTEECLAFIFTVLICRQQESS